MMNKRNKKEIKIKKDPKTYNFEPIQTLQVHSLKYKDFICWLALMLTRILREY